MKYLGLSTDEKNCFKAQSSEMLKNATKLAHMTHSVVIVLMERTQIKQK